MPDFPILTDGDVYSEFDYEQVVDAMRDAFAERAAGTLEAPPRWHVDAGEGELVFTAGSATGPANVTGFRVYETPPVPATSTRNWWPSSMQPLARSLACSSGSRSAGSGPAASVASRSIASLARTARRSGFSARGFRLERRSVRRVPPATSRSLVYSPTAESRESFVETTDGEVEPPVRALDDPEPVVRDADALVCATNSEEPVFDPNWLEPGTHVTTIGPRFRDAHELPLDVVDRADAIATDSLPQVDAYDRPYVASGDDRERMVELADVLENPDLGRQRADDITLFCSVGLAGTEVVLGTTFLERFA